MECPLYLNPKTSKEHHIGLREDNRQDLFLIKKPAQLALGIFGNTLPYAKESLVFSNDLQLYVKSPPIG